ncbi:MAG: putative glycoside hydrolase/deacetylase ChbG (UPF0249 family) [Parasphingorhabdus sp.]|jgi:predicted glycoside hydrolase/deacetylase ChbG (UPF0249 family)/glycosyltransferase involved in cell wall biosynthesis
MSFYLIINADDYGYYPNVSKGIIHAIQHGLVTATGVITNGENYNTQLTWLLPHKLQVDIGVHLNLTEGYAVSEVMHQRLIHRRGKFCSVKELLLLMAAKKLSGQDILCEFRAQIDRLIDAGVKPVFVNSHEHIQLLPSIEEQVRKVRDEFEIKHVRRVSVDSIMPATGNSIVRNLTLGLLAKVFDQKSLPKSPQLLGLTASGKLTMDYFKRYIDKIVGGKTYELMCHPGFDEDGSRVARKASGYHHWGVELVDDGSRDNTFTALEAMTTVRLRLAGIKLSRNFGKEAALLAGLKAAKGDAVITMDADHQHPPDCIPAMLKLWQQGNMVVNGRKQDYQRKNAVVQAGSRIFNSFLNRGSSFCFTNASDFKLLDRSIVEILCQDIGEFSRFYRGLVCWVGYRQIDLEYSVSSRHSGDSQWSLLAMAELAITAITSFTNRPLRLITMFGVFMLLFAVLVSIDALIFWSTNHPVSGFATTIMTLLIVGSLTLISLGIIGEYIAKIYEEVKSRPMYLI